MSSIAHGLSSFLLGLPDLFQGSFLTWFLIGGLALAAVMLFAYIQSIRRGRRK